VTADHSDTRLPEGFHFLPGYFDGAAQLVIVSDLHVLLESAPLFQQRMPKTGAPLSVRMSNAGEFGWVTDRKGGYRYQATHPVTGKAWPAIPTRLLKTWDNVTGEIRPPNLCLINYYDTEARLGSACIKIEGNRAWMRPWFRSRSETTRRSCSADYRARTHCGDSIYTVGTSSGLEVRHDLSFMVSKGSIRALRSCSSARNGSCDQVWRRVGSLAALGRQFQGGY
jgi:2OG-Fe(II) oxygenase superfamily